MVGPFSKEDRILGDTPYFVRAATCLIARSIASAKTGASIPIFSVRDVHIINRSIRIYMIHCAETVIVFR